MRIGGLGLGKTLYDDESLIDLLKNIQDKTGDDNNCGSLLENFRRHTYSHPL